MKSALLGITALLLLAALAMAQDESQRPPASPAPRVELRKQVFEFNGRSYEGTFAVPRPGPAEVPAVIIVPDWMGPSRYFDSIAEDLAEMGYLAYVADVYGVDVRPKNPEEAARAASALRDGDRTELRNRMEPALAQVLAEPRVDDSRVAAMGYCFGGSAALELARSGADIAACVTFHGGLGGGEPGSAARIKAKVLILHGSEDPLAPWEELTALVKEMDAADVDFHVVAYGGAHHSFTQPQAQVPGTAEYDPVAAARSWEHLKLFLDEVFHGEK